jgi:hypothetical protein
MFAQTQGYTGGANPNSYSCGGTTCMTPEVDWLPLETDGQLQNNSAQLVRTVNGAKFLFGTKSEDLTLGTGAQTTDTTGNLLPANSLLLGVTGAVTTAITGSCTGWSLGDSTNSARFASNNTTLTAGATSIGLNLDVSQVALPDESGTITLSSNTGTYTFAGTYSAAPSCVCTDTTTANLTKCATTTTTLTATDTVGATDVIAYSCRIPRGKAQVAAAKIRVSCAGGNPSAGKVRLTSYFLLPLAPLP